MKKLLIFFMLLQLGNVNAQNAAKDLAAAYNSYLGNYLSLDFTVTVFNTKDDKTGHVEGTGMIRKSKDNYYSRYAGTELVNNGSEQIVVNRKTKTIIVTNSKKHATTQAVSAAVMDTTLMTSYDSVKYSGIANGMKKYSVYNSSLPVYRTDMYIDPSNNLISKIEYYYKANTSEVNYDMYKMVIDYKSASTGKFTASSLFNRSRYVTEHNKKLVPATEFSNYKIKILQ